MKIFRLGGSSASESQNTVMSFESANEVLVVETSVLTAARASMGGFKNPVTNMMYVMGDAANCEMFNPYSTVSNCVAKAGGSADYVYGCDCRSSSRGFFVGRSNIYDFQFSNEVCAISKSSPDGGGDRAFCCAISSIGGVWRFSGYTGLDKNISRLDMYNDLNLNLGDLFPVIYDNSAPLINLDNRIYLMGTGDGGDNFPPKTTIMTFDPYSNVLATAAAVMSSGRCYSTSASAGSIGYIFGGATTGDWVTLTDAIDVFNYENEVANTVTKANLPAALSLGIALTL